MQGFGSITFYFVRLCIHLKDTYYQYMILITGHKKPLGKKIIPIWNFEDPKHCFYGKHFIYLNAIFNFYREKRICSISGAEVEDT